MGFRDSYNSDSRDMKIKINMFLKNARRRHPTTPEKRVCVNKCLYEGSLASHLHGQIQCCSDHIEEHLPNRSAVYRGKVELAVFDLGNLLFFCPNPACPDDGLVTTTKGKVLQDARAMSQHIRGSCLEFYQRAGTSLFRWPKDLNPDSIITKLKNRRRELRRSMRNTEEQRMDAYKEEFNALLEKQCQMCLIRGPLSGHEKHDLHLVEGTVGMPDSKVYMCSACLRGEEKQMDIIHNYLAKVQDLSVAKPGDTAAMVAVEVEHPQTHAKRVVFVPSQLKDDLQIVGDNIPYNATVLVPNQPEALDQLQKECFDRAHDDKESLR